MTMKTLIADRGGPYSHASLPRLTAPQRQALEQIEEGFQGHLAAFVSGAQGSGRTLVLEHLQAKLGGRILRAEDAFRAFARRDPAAMEEALIDLIADAHEDHDIVYFDDLNLVSIPTMVADRPGYSDQLFRSYVERAGARGKKIVLSWTGRDPDHFGVAFAMAELGKFGPVEYRAILEHHCASTLGDVDYDELYRAYRGLSGNALAFLGRLIRMDRTPHVTTAEVIAIADTYLAQTNVDLDEVAPVSFDTLVGVETVFETIERTILIPMTQPALAREFGLKPKRGVLLHGEPGTGKTTIGRALAQRMKGKFFMIDGTFMPDDQFYHKFNRVLSNAVKMSPSVIFIDDADVLFRNGEMIGLARLLLSKLDGLESETQSQICIVMTAMRVADMPPAMVRSGRVEVWLEMKLPDGDRRTQMVRHFASSLPVGMRDFDDERIADATDGFTPADLRGLVGDARGHLAYDRQRGNTTLRFEEYLLIAASEIAGRKSVLRALHP